jgi:hypothetical protein
MSLKTIIEKGKHMNGRGNKIGKLIGLNQHLSRKIQFTVLETIFGKTKNQSLD